MRNKRVIISGGGTGGHVFPALAIAGALRKRDPGIEILFVGAKHKMEMEKVPGAGYKIIGLPVTGFQRKITFSNLLFFPRLMISLIKSRCIVKKFNPDVAIGVGGYASGPVLKIANRLNIPTIIQEQNSYAGVTNRLLAKKSEKICVAYDGMEKYFPGKKIVMTGNPVRKEVLNKTTDLQSAQKHFNIKSKNVILVLGGSLGAGTINRSVMGAIEQIISSGAEIIWQCGRYYYKDIISSFENGIPENIKIYDFIERMDLAYKVAGIIISRAGALTISELCLVGKPCILVPSPNVAEDHQTKNAKSLVNKGASLMVKDMDAEKELMDKAINLLKDIALKEKLADNIKKMARYDSDELIADEVFKILGNNAD